VAIVVLSMSLRLRRFALSGPGTAKPDDLQLAGELGERANQDRPPGGDGQGLQGQGIFDRASVEADATGRLRRGRKVGQLTLERGRHRPRSGSAPS